MAWDGSTFELSSVPYGHHRGRAIVAVKVPGGAVVVDVRDLRGEPQDCYPQHLCSEYLATRGSLRRAGAD